MFCPDYTATLLTNIFLRAKRISYSEKHPEIDKETGRKIAEYEDDF